MEKVISMWNRPYINVLIFLATTQLLAQDSRECVDSVITSLPFFHEGVLEADMGDDWDFQGLPDTVDLFTPTFSNTLPSDIKKDEPPPSFLSFLLQSLLINFLFPFSNNSNSLQICLCK